MVASIGSSGGDGMDPDRATAMREATALVRAGRLAEATALIRRSISGAPPAPPGEVVPGEVVPGEVVPGEALDDGAPDRRRPPADGRPGRAGARAGGDLGAAAPDLVGSTSGPPAGPALPGGTSVHTHHGAAGARPYILSVPAAGTGPRPLVVMLHGGTQTAADFAAATRMSGLAEEHGFLVAYPEQVTSANQMRYWNWFEPGDQHRGAGEPAVLTGIVGEIAAAHAVDRDRVYVAGFSAGAAMAAVLGAAYPDVFAAVGVHSGVPYGCAHDVASAFTAMRGVPSVRPLRHPLPVIAFHGDADQTVAAENATRLVEQFTGGPAQGDTVVERGPGRPATRTLVRRDGVVAGERWMVHGSGHAWSGGVAGGSYTDPAGPDASAEMVRFFAGHPR
jgi:poly(hydroxyalkanoate) depolymerase family esterase